MGFFIYDASRWREQASRHYSAAPKKAPKRWYDDGNEDSQGKTSRYYKDVATLEKPPEGWTPRNPNGTKGGDND